MCYYIYTIQQLAKDHRRKKRERNIFFLYSVNPLHIQKHRDCWRLCCYISLNFAVSRNENLGTCKLVAYVQSSSTNTISISTSLFHQMVAVICAKFSTLFFLVVLFVCVSVVEMRGEYQVAYLDTRTRPRVGYAKAPNPQKFKNE